MIHIEDQVQVLLVSGNHRIDDNKAERERLLEAGGDIAQADLDGKGVGPLRVWPGGLAFSRCAAALCSLAIPSADSSTIASSLLVLV